MGVDERMREIIIQHGEDCREVDIENDPLWQQVLSTLDDKAVAALKSCLGDEIRGMKQVANSNRPEIDLLVEGYNDAIDDVLRVVGE